MKLRTIIENIDKTDFFDFYALVYVHQSLNNSIVDPEYKEEVRKELLYIARYIYEDHMNQLSLILLNRWLSENNQQEYEDAGVRIGEEDFGTGFYIPTINDKDVLRLSFKDRAKLLERVVSYGHHGFTGETWEGLANKYVQLADTNPKNLSQLILAIDRIYGLVHHGGAITDYFDEHAWLESALNMKAISSPQNMIMRASNRVRELLTSAGVGVPALEDVTLAQELEIALNRLERSYKMFGQSLEPIDSDSFKLTLTFRIANSTNSPFQKPMPIGWGKMYHYYRWEGHDKSQDEEFDVTVYGSIDYDNIHIYHDGEKLVDVPTGSKRSKHGARQLASTMIHNVFTSIMKKLKVSEF